MDDSPSGSFFLLGFCCLRHSLSRSSPWGHYLDVFLEVCCILLDHVHDAHLSTTLFFSVFCTASGCWTWGDILCIVRSLLVLILLVLVSCVSSSGQGLMPMGRLIIGRVWVLMAWILFLPFIKLFRISLTLIIWPWQPFELPSYGSYLPCGIPRYL